MGSVHAVESSNSGGSVSGPNTHKILQAAVQWHKWLTGKGPANATISTSESMAEIRLEGVLTRLEVMASQNAQGQQRVKMLRHLLMKMHERDLAGPLADLVPWEQYALLFEINVERDVLYLWISANT